MFPELMLPQKSPEQIAAVEKRIGRKLHPSEVIHGQLLRKPTFHSPIYRERVFGEGEGDLLERQIAEARKAVRDEKYAAMGPAERQLAMLEEMQEQSRVKAATEAAAAERFKAVEPYLKKVSEQLAAHAFDETWDHDSYEVLVQAKKHLSQPELNAALGLELFQKGQDIVAEKDNAKKSEGQKKLDALIAEKARLEAELGVDPTPAPAPVKSDAAWGEFKAAQNALRAAKAAGATPQEIHKLLNESEAKLKAYDALKPATSPPPAATPPAQTTEAAA